MFENYVVLMLQLALGIQAIAPAGRPVSPRRAALYARAVAYHGARQHVDPFELVALARNESDFNDKTIGPDGLDCGVTQTRITYSRYTCSELQGSPWIAFAEAARELHAYARSCRGRADFDRCRLNRYNSGVRYARKGFHGRYYLRLGCFAAAARGRLKPKDKERCRSVQSEEQLALWVREATGAPPPETLEATSRLAQAPAAYSDIRRESTPPWQVTVLTIDPPADDPTPVAIIDRAVQGRRRARRHRGPIGRGRATRRARTSCGAPTRPGGRSRAGTSLRWSGDRSRRDGLPGCG